jgi:hypothetical protein
MSLRVPGYEWNPVNSGRTGEKPRKGQYPARMVLHTTEGLRLYDYPYPPAFSIALVGDPYSLEPGRYWKPDGQGSTVPVTFETGDKVKLQHCELDMTSYALLHRPGDDETNHMGEVCVQTEIITAARYGAVWTDEFIDFVAEHVADVMRALGTIDITIDWHEGPPFVGWAEGAGFDAPSRMTWDEWQNFGGLTSHQSVPGNDHWDIGPVDRTRLVEAIDRHMFPDIPAPLPWPGLIEKGDTDPIVRVLRADLYRLGYAGWRYLLSRRYTGGMVNQVKKLQADHGLVADGMVGPKTRELLATLISDSM